MIITGLEVSGVGRFRSPTRLAGLRAGINVLAAPNEAGKSTLFRALRACVFQRHDATQSAVRSLATADAALPASVAVTFERGGRSYRIAKSFVRGASASLSRDGTEIARGRQADEMLWELLGLSPGSGKSIDDATYGLLWVGQTQSFEPPSPSEGASSVLAEIIGAEVGGLVGGERGRAVLAAVRAELKAFETETGKPRTGGSWKAALDAVERLQAEEAELSAKFQELEQGFRELASARAELGRVEDPAQRAEQEAELATARAAHEVARQAAERLARLALEAEAAESQEAAARERLDALTAAAERIAAAEASLERLDDEIAAHDAEAARHQSALAGAATALAEAQTRLGERTEALARLDRLGRALDTAERHAQVQERRDEAARLLVEIAKASEALAATRATRPLVQEAETLEREIATLEARREASAPRLAIALAPGAGEKVRLNGGVLRADAGRPLLKPTTIAVDGIVTVTLTPAAGGAEHLVALSEKQGALSALLGRMGADNVAGARDALAEADATRRDRDTLSARLALLLPRGKAGADGLAALDTELAESAGLVAGALAAAGLTALPDAAELDLERTEALAAERALRDERQEAEAALTAAREALNQAQAALAGLRGQRHQVEQTLAAASRASPPTQRSELLGAARQAHVAAVARVAEAAAALDRERTLHAPERLDAAARKVERLTQALVNADEARAELQERVARIEGALDALGGDGVGEALQKVQAERELAERALQRTTEEVESLRLLRDTIVACLAEGRDRFVAPVKQHLRPLLHDVFPGAELDLGDGFALTGLARDGGQEAFDALSAGTREQIAVLVRLAFGGLLASRGDPSPIILDDALVFSDDERIDRMFDALGRVAERQQVIVLTCRTRAFRALGGTLLRLESAA